MASKSNSNKVWYRYEAKQKNGCIIKLRFQDLAPHRKEEAIEILCTYMLKEEAFQRATGIYKNEEAVEEYRNILNMLFEDKQVTMCCIDDETENGGEMVGLSIVDLMKNTDSINNLANKFPVESFTKEMQSLFNMIKELEKLTDLKNQFDRFYYGNGIIVIPDYRGLGIANDFVRLRQVMCKEHDVPMTSAWMTAKGTQRAAEKNNWNTHTVITPEELGKICGLTFVDNSIEFKYMYITKD